MEQLLSKYEAICAKEYANQTGAKQAMINPELIAILLDVGMQLVKLCMNRNKTSGENVVERARMGGIATRFALRRALREAGETPSRDLVETLLRVGSTADPEDLEQFSRS